MRVHYVHYIETEFADVRADMFIRGHIHYIAMQAGNFMTQCWPEYVRNHRYSEMNQRDESTNIIE